MSLKKDFITALRIISHEGLSDAFTHLSARVDGGKKMLFMPRKSPALVMAKELFIIDFDKTVPQSAVHQAGQVESPERAAEIVKILGAAKAVIVRGHGAVVVGKNIRESCTLALYLEESARLQVEAIKLGKPKFLSQGEAERIAKTTFKPASTERA
jgi:ribulose-5-phosphate 4-epimerase/fuculose-1-phosphate aldolase